MQVEREIAALQNMNSGQLGEKSAELFGEAATLRHKVYLIRKIVLRFQTHAEQDLSDGARLRRGSRNWRVHGEVEIAHCKRAKGRQRIQKEPVATEAVTNGRVPRMTLIINLLHLAPDI